MLLFDSLHMASAAMSASQLGMQVVGQNLTNAQTPGYVREQLILETGTSRKLGNGTVVGTGVQVSGVSQVIDNFLEERLRTSNSDYYSSATQQNYYTQLEALLNETTDLDLSSSIEEFFNSIDNILNQPENTTYREMAASQGEKLATDINRIALTIVEMQRDINTSVSNAAEEINRLLKEIQELNTNIALVEGGHESREALGLRDQRLDALSGLSQYINIKTVEDANTGAVTIYCGSDLLLMDNVRNEVYVGGKKEDSDDVLQSILCLRETMSPMDVRSGSVYGLYQAHETILGGYLEKLDDFSSKLIEEFNKVYSSGQGMNGYSSLTSLATVNTPDQPIGSADLDYAVVNGVFTIQRYDTKTGVTTDWAVQIEVEEQPTVDPFSIKPAPQAGGTTLNDVAQAINEIEGLSARVTPRGELEIVSDNPNYQFAFSNDSSGFLTAMGLNTFFTGTSAASIGVNRTVLDDPSTFAASSGGIGNDTDNGVLLAAMAVDKNPALGNKSVVDYYGGIVSETMLAAGTMKSIASSDSLYLQSLQTQRDSISGVNIDEETILMMTYQRMFQANSKFVGYLNEMLETLMNI